MLRRGGSSTSKGETPLHTAPHHRQEHTSPGNKGTSVIPTAIPTPRDLQGRGSKLLYLVLFSTAAEAEIACGSVPGSFKSVVWLVVGPWVELQLEEERGKCRRGNCCGQHVYELRPGTDLGPLL